MIPVLALWTAVGVSLMLAAGQLAADYQSRYSGRWFYRSLGARPGGYRLVGAFFIGVALWLGFMAARQGNLLVAFLPGTVALAVLLGIGVLLHRGGRRWGAWLPVAVIAGVIGLVIAASMFR